MIDINLRMEVSKGLRASGVTVDQVCDELAPAIGSALALAIRGRVSERGDLAGQMFPGYSTRAAKARKNFAVSGRYPGAMGETGPSGAQFFTSSDAFHAGVTPGSYNVSGGMWNGLTMMVLTRTLVRLLFRGRSEGQAPNFRAGKQHPVKASNALKAWTVLEKHHVNVLALSEQELDRIGVGVVRAVAMGVGNELPVEWEGEAPPRASVSAILSAAIGGG